MSYGQDSIRAAFRQAQSCTSPLDLSAVSNRVYGVSNPKPV
jgi:hypothetical protein